MRDQLDRVRRLVAELRESRTREAHLIRALQLEAIEVQRLQEELRALREGRRAA